MAAAAAAEMEARAATGVPGWGETLAGFVNLASAFFVALGLGLLRMLIAIGAAFLFAVGMAAGSIVLLLVLIGGGALLAPVTVNQDPLVATAANVLNTIVPSFSGLLGLLNDLIECVEPLFVLFNLLTEFVLGVARRVTEAIPGVPDLFSWARVVQLEAALRARDRLEESEAHVLLMVEQARERMLTMPAAEARLHADRVVAQASGVGWLRGATLDTRDPRVLGVLVDAICSLIRTVVGFIIDALDLVFGFVLDLVDFVLENFFDGGNLSGDPIIIFAQFVVEAILDELGFRECFEDLPDGIIICLCPWRYDEPYDFPGALDFSDDDFPSDPIVGLAGCLCPDFGKDVSGFTSIVDVLLECTPLGAIVDAFTSLLNEVENVLRPIIDGLRDTVGGLIDDVEGLIDTVENIGGGGGGFLSNPFRGPMADEDGEVHTTANADELGGTGRRAGRRERRAGTGAEAQRDADIAVFMSHHTASCPVTDVECMRRQRAAFEERPVSMRESVEKIKVLAGRIRQQARTIGSVWRRSEPTDVGARVLARAERHPAFGGLLQRARASRDPETIRNHAAILAGVRHALKVGATVMRSASSGFAGNRTTRGEAPDRHLFYEALGEVDWRGLIQAVQRQARHQRALRGEEPDLPSEAWRPLDVGLQLGLAALATPESVPHVARWLGQRYAAAANGTAALRAGVDWALHAQRGFLPGQLGLRPMASVLEAARDLGLDDEGLRAEERRVRDGLGGAYGARRARMRAELDEALDQRDVSGVVSRGVGLGVASAVRGAGLGVAASVRVVPILAPIALAPALVLAPLFLSDILNVVTTAASGTITAALSGPQTVYETQSWSPISPYIDLWRGAVLDSFETQISAATIEGLLQDSVDLTVDQAQYLVNLVIRRQLSRFPFLIGGITSPPLPVIGPNGQPTQGVLGYVIDYINCDPTAVCGDWDSCLGLAPCRCPLDPFVTQSSFYRDLSIPRQRTAVPGLPCRFGDSPAAGPRGRCSCHPFLQTGYLVEEPTVSVSTSLDCEATFGWDPLSAAFWQQDLRTYLGSVYTETLRGLRQAVRYVIYLEPVQDENIFGFLVGLAPCACLWPIMLSWSQTSLAINASYQIRLDVAGYLRDLSVANAGLPLVGGLFSALTPWVEAPLEDGALTCLVLNSSTVLVGAGATLILAYFVIGLFTSGAVWFALSLVWTVVNFLVFGLALRFVYMFVTAVRMARAGQLVGQAGPTPDAGAGRALPLRPAPPRPLGPATPGVPDLRVARSAEHLGSAGVRPAGAPVAVGDQAVVRVGRRGPPRPLSWPQALFAGAGIVARSAPLWLSPAFVRAAWRHNPADGANGIWRPSGVGRADLHVPHARYDHTSHQDDLPALQFLRTENGVALLHDPNYAVCDRAWYFGERPDCEVARPAVQ